MKIEKAIELLENMHSFMKEKYEADDRAALKLGLEALDRVLAVRRFPDAANWKPLPGEDVGE